MNEALLPQAAIQGGGASSACHHARLLELVLLSRAMSNLADDDEEVTWPVRNCRYFGGVLLELAPGEHTAARCVVSTSASALEQIKKAVSTVLKSGAHEDFSFVSDALRALPPLLRAIAALEWMSDAVELEERTPLDCSPLERQAAQVFGSLEEAARLLRAYQDFTEVPHLLSEIAQAQISAAELLVLCCAHPMKFSTLQARGVPIELPERLCAACGVDLTADANLWSRVGQAKYKVYTPGKRSMKKRREKDHVED